MTHKHPLRWTKSSRSGGSGGNCVEVAVDDDQAHVRDSKVGDSPILTVSVGEFTALLNSLK